MSADSEEVAVSWRFTKRNAIIKVELAEATVKIKHPIDEPELAVLIVQCLPPALFAALDAMFPEENDPSDG